MAEAVKVAVRVRPFNEREIKRKATVIIGMNGASTEIKDPENTKQEPKRFAFDYSYWSHDEYKERSDGYLEPTGSKYADQKKVFNDLGMGVLDNAWQGYNTSLFAYGQTGSGKSYSMVGYGNNKGIVPLACNELFRKIEAKRSGAADGEEYQVSFSMLEIYSEQVRDLLNPKTISIKGGLKVRQDPKGGFYVEGMKYFGVNSYNEISQKIDEGTQNRTVASTAMNATSSRAHTIVSITFKQKSNATGKSMTKTSLINLVDLAGSERAESTGATGDRLKEGAAINLSLSTLGNVIKALADASTAKGKSKIIVPYRDSVLTKLLKNALGGNSKTIMIAALSPADINYDETLSTLRFADRAKAIKTTATVNESPTDKLIRELREENARLMDMLKKGGVDPAMAAIMADGGGGGGGGGGGVDQEEMDRIKADMEAEIRKNEEEMEEMKRSWEEKMKGQELEYQEKLKAKSQEDEKKKTVPYLWNLNEDAALSGMITYFCGSGKTLIGKKANEKANIKLNGVGISKEHAVINNSKDTKVTLKPMKGCKVFLNGNEITGEKEVHHNDIVMFGSGKDWFVMHHPKDFAKQQKDGKSKEPIVQPSYEKAEEMMAANSGIQQMAGTGSGSKEDLLLQEDLMQIWPMMCEANAMSEELNKKVKFEIALISPQARGLADGRTEVNVKMKDMKSGNEFMCSRADFLDRKFIMQEMYQNFQDGDKDWDRKKQDDPFYEDPTCPVLIGTVNLYMQSLCYKIEMQEQLTVTDYKGQEMGHLFVEVLPTDKTGKPLPEDDFCDDPAELVGQELSFKMKVLKARGIPKRFKQTFAKYQLNNMPQSGEGTTGEKQGVNPDFNYEKVHTYKTVTNETVSYLNEKAVSIEMWGRQAACEDNTGDLNTRELMKKDSVMVSGGAKSSDVNDHHYKMAAEASTFKKRMERAEAKLAKIKGLCDKANKEKKDSVKLKEVSKHVAEEKEAPGKKGAKKK